MGMEQYHHVLPCLAYHEDRGKVRQVLRKNPYNSNYNFSIGKSEKQSLKITRIEQILEFRDKTRYLLQTEIFTKTMRYIKEQHCSVDEVCFLCE